jgi:hypothetical protein
MRDGALGGAAALAPAEDVTAVEALRGELPAFLARSRQLLRLAELAATGPDPDSLLPDVAELERTCAKFLRAHS